MNFDPEAFSRQIPYYLTADPSQKEFLKDLASLVSGSNRGYFAPTHNDPFSDDMLQGDGWRGFLLYSFDLRKTQKVRGIVLSNSCDISPENPRMESPKVTFAPIVKLSRLVDRFESFGIDRNSIEDRVRNIKAQKATSIFYMPKEGPLEEDYVALLDDLHSMPLQARDMDAEKLFTLSMAGFYLFIFKLSIHFCRLHENVRRS